MNEIMMTQKIEVEKSKRELLLNACGVDTSGFGLLNIFSLYDHVVESFSWLSWLLHKIGLNKAALALSHVDVWQFKKHGLEIWQTVKIDNRKGSFVQEGWIHDQEPEQAIQYICTKYKLNSSPLNIGLKSLT